jgi:hypothetical protein
MHNKPRLLKLASVVLLLVPYLMYVGFIIRGNRGPVDYETFMAIGHRLITGNQVYGENSYYPMPFVMIFALFSLLPRPVSMAVWLLAPVILALIITGGNPLTLLFAPVFGHFVGGQTAVFGMLGLWGYRKHIESSKTVGGFFLALTLLKPQLGVIPLAFAVVKWWEQIRILKRVPQQAWAWMLATILLFAPGFFLVPDWPSQWLSSPRPLFERAMSGFVPRTLLYIVTPQTTTYWLILIGVAVLILVGVWFLNHKQITLDLAVVWGFIVSPLVHDYDLIQLVPILEKRTRLLVIAVLLSIPGWFVILFAYSSNSAWYAFTIIAPGILCALLYQRQKSLMQASQIASTG